MSTKKQMLFEYEIEPDALSKGLVASINRTYLGLIIMFLIQIMFFTTTPNQKQTVVLGVAGATLAFYLMGRWAHHSLFKLLPVRVHLNPDALVLEYLNYSFLPMGASQREWIHIHLAQINAIEPGEKPLSFMFYPSEVTPSYYVKTAERQYYVFLGERAEAFKQALNKAQS